MARKKTSLTWTQVKPKVSELDRGGLVELIRDLYAAKADNRDFLHTRFGLNSGAEPLDSYKKTIQRYMWPNPTGRGTVSPAKAKEAITAYKRALGDPSGLAELMILFCEQGVGFSAAYGYHDDSLQNSLWRMFEQAIQTVSKLPKSEREPFVARLYAIRDIACDGGMGFYETLSELLCDL